MINKPSLNELVDKVGCRYMLVTVVSQRARQLLEHPEQLNDQKPVSYAVQELEDGKLTIDYPKEYGLNHE